MSCSQNNELERFLAGELTPEEEAAFAEHLAKCPQCCEAMVQLLEFPSLKLEEAASFEFLQELEPPAGLSENIVREMLRQKRREFRQYCVRVAVSSAAAVAIVFTSFAGASQEIFSPRITEPLTLSQKMEQEEAFANALREFSLSEFCMEVLNHAKEK